MESKTPQKLLTVRQAADLVPLPTSTNGVTRWITLGVDGKRLPARKLGGRWAVDASDLERFLIDIGYK